MSPPMAPRRKGSRRAAAPEVAREAGRPDREHGRGGGRRPAADRDEARRDQTDRHAPEDGERDEPEHQPDAVGRVRRVGRFREREDGVDEAGRDRRDGARHERAPHHHTIVTAPTLTPAATPIASTFVPGTSAPAASASFIWSGSVMLLVFP